ncbi:MAG: hypothetical protein IT376_00480 [Polyangiaceae bacterium]|nr:hypothetical protein [Polyangiaceae bacterium]
MSGRVVAEGTPAEVAQGGTATAPVLRAELEAAGRGVGGRARRRAR